MYYLMNKNNIIASFHFETNSSRSDISGYFKIDNIGGTLPYGFDSINNWLENRKSSKHNAHLKKIMKELGCAENTGYIDITHACSINDTFWVKTDKENIQWEQVSLYKNKFSEAVSKLAFEGVGLYNHILSSTSPELSCEGSFKKCFKKEDVLGQYGSDIFVYKRGRDDASNTGLEPYSEMLSSQIAQIISPNSVSYELITLHNKTATRCNLFTSEKYGYVPCKNLVKENTYFSSLDYFCKHNAEQEFREMILIDALCFNEDRHKGNFGMLFDNDTLELVRMSPIFDLNISLLTYHTDDKLLDIGNALYSISPKIGGDFTAMGQEALNDTLKDKLKDMKDFTFSFRGDDVFSPNRVKILEQTVQKQASAILSNQMLRTSDVFISSDNLTKIEQKEKSLKAQKKLLAYEKSIEKELANTFLGSVTIDTNEVKYFIEDIDNCFEMTIDFLSDTTDIVLDEKRISSEELKLQYPKAYKFYQKFVSLEKDLKTINEQNVSIES